MSDMLRNAAIALISRKATPTQLDDIVRQLQSLPPRPKDAEPLMSLFSHIEMVKGSKAATESQRSPDFDPNNINWEDNNCKISRYFTVGEVTNRDSRRIPTQQHIIDAVLKMAAELDKVREAWAHPIGVTSWYRPPAINAAVGGASQSQHLTGGAADIYPMAGGSVHDFQKWLDSKWGGALGYGASRGFVHVDLREGGYGHGPGWIRWNY